MSSINIVIIKRSQKANIESHYSGAMRIIERNDFKQLNDILKHQKGWAFSSEPVDAGVIIFDLGKKTIDGRDQGGFNAHNLKRIPAGWKFIEKGINGETDIVTSKNFKQNKKKWINYFNHS
jgi:hypothetical protein